MAEALWRVNSPSAPKAQIRKGTKRYFSSLFPRKLILSLNSQAIFSEIEAMARIRSPGYPNLPLEDVIELARKIHDADRQNPIDRETAVRHLGFAGQSGASDRALSALMHFQLAEKVQKGEIRITDLALQIIHPDSPKERREAIRTVGFSPSLFQELRARYPDAPPSKDGLSSYLTRSGFASAAVGPATKAYLETCHFLQREGAYAENDTGQTDAVMDADPETNSESGQRSTTAPPTEDRHSGSRHHQTILTPDENNLNKINMNIQGNLVHLEALLDWKGLQMLKRKIAGLEVLLEESISEIAD